MRTAAICPKHYHFRIFRLDSTWFWALNLNKRSIDSWSVLGEKVILRPLLHTFKTNRNQYFHHWYKCWYMDGLISAKYVLLYIVVIHSNSWIPETLSCKTLQICIRIQKKSNLVSSLTLSGLCTPAFINNNECSWLYCNF